MKSIVIMGATSGLGKEAASIFLKMGWKVGATGRRFELLESFKNSLDVSLRDNLEIEKIDINSEEAIPSLESLISRLGGMDIYLNSSGMGRSNPDLDLEIELNTISTNALAFVKVMNFVYKYFKVRGVGQIAAITSVAGTKGIGISPSYSSTKSFQSTYITALSQLSHIDKVKIGFTDIRPGFVSTDFIHGKKYPMLMTVEYASRKLVRSLLKRKRVVIIDWRYSILVFIWRLIPNFIWERIPLSE